MSFISVVVPVQLAFVESNGEKAKSSCLFLGTLICPSTAAAAGRHSLLLGLKPLELYPHSYNYVTPIVRKASVAFSLTQ